MLPAEVDRQLGKLLTSDAMQSMRDSRFGPMFFPNVLFVLGGAVFVGLLASGQLRRPAETEPLSWRDLGRLAEVAVCVMAYIVFAETAGFLITGGCCLCFSCCAWAIAGSRALPPVRSS